MNKSTKRAIGALVLLAILAWHYAAPRPCAQGGCPQATTLVAG